MEYAPPLAPAAPPVPLTAPARQRYKVTGPVGTVRLPSVCACCGAAPDGTLRIHKMFRRTDSDSPTRYLFGTLDAPFCAACRATHDRQLTPIDPKVTRRLMMEYGLKILPYLFPIAIALFLLTKVVPIGLKTVRDYGILRWETWLGLGLVAFFGVVLLGFVHLVREARTLLIGGTQEDPNDTYVRLVPTPVGGHFIIAGAPTPVLASVDFTDDTSELFDGERHVFRFTQPEFGAQFGALNAARLWDGRSAVAQRNRGWRRMVFWLVLVVGAALTVYDWVS